ncbi:MAG: alpha/beta hydrolase [Gemmatimonadota bacterium]
MGGVSAGEGWFAGADGTRLFRRWWRPAAPASRVLVNVHGLGDHSGLYAILAERMVPRGYAVHMLDLRGHGRSEGRRGHIDSWQQFRNDLGSLLRLVQQEEPGRPVVLLGNSLGGCVVLDFTLEQPEGLAGVAAAAPAIGAVSVPAWLLALGRGLSRVWPTLSLQTGMDLSGISRDAVAARTIVNDPLFHRVGTARLAAEFLRAAERVQERAGALRVPALLLHGAADRMVPPDGSRRFTRAAPRELVTLIEYPGAYHALLADLDRERVMQDLDDWITRVTDGRAHHR